MATDPKPVCDCAAQFQEMRTRPSPRSLLRIPAPPSAFSSVRRSATSRPSATRCSARSFRGQAALLVSTRNIPAARRYGA